jgi:hypothetical protein
VIAMRLGYDANRSPKAVRRTWSQGLAALDQVHRQVGQSVFNASAAPGTQTNSYSYSAKMPRRVNISGTAHSAATPGVQNACTNMLILPLDMGSQSTSSNTSRPLRAATR